MVEERASRAPNGWRVSSAIDSPSVGTWNGRPIGASDSCLCWGAGTWNLYVYHVIQCGCYMYIYIYMYIVYAYLLYKSVYFWQEWWMHISRRMYHSCSISRWMRFADLPMLTDRGRRIPTIPLRWCSLLITKRCCWFGHIGPKHSCSFGPPTLSETVETASRGVRGMVSPFITLGAILVSNPTTNPVKYEIVWDGNVDAPKVSGQNPTAKPPEIWEFLQFRSTRTPCIFGSHIQSPSWSSCFFSMSGRQKGYGSQGLRLFNWWSPQLPILFTIWLYLIISAVFCFFWLFGSIGQQASRLTHIGHLFCLLIK